MQRRNPAGFWSLHDGGLGLTAPSPCRRDSGPCMVVDLASLPLTLQVNLMLVLLTLLTFIHPFLVNRECQRKESPREVA